MKKKQKVIIGVCTVVCVGGLAVGIFFAGRGKDGSKEERAYVMSISSMNQMAGVQRIAGVVESQKTLDIQKDTEREVKEILVKAGDEVEVGTSLFTYDTASLETDLQQARLDLERADNEISNLRTQIAQLQKEKKEASEDDQFSYTTQIQSAEMDVKKAEYDRKGKEVEITRLQNKIENSTVTSEMKGVVKSVNQTNDAEMNMYADSSQAFMTILATGEYRVKGKVNEQNFSEVVEGERAIIRSRVNEDAVWTGTYTAVDTQNPNSNNNNMYMVSSNDNEQTSTTSYPFYVELDSSEGLLLGQHVYIEKDTGLAEREAGIWLDEAFLTDTDTKPYVWIEAGDTLEKRNVVLGTYDEAMMQYRIEKGLKSSDYVAYPQEFLEEGMKTTHEISEAMSADDGMEGEALPEESDNMEGEVLPEESDGMEGEVLPEGSDGMEGEVLPEESDGVEGEILPEESNGASKETQGAFAERLKKETQTAARIFPKQEAYQKEDAEAGNNLLRQEFLLAEKRTEGKSLLPRA